MRALRQEQKWLHFHQIHNEKESASLAFTDPSARRDKNWQRATKVIKCADLAHARTSSEERGSRVMDGITAKRRRLKMSKQITKTELSQPEAQAHFRAE